MYKLFRPLLFLIDPEKIHHLVFMALQVKGKLPGFRKLLSILFDSNEARLARTFCGIRFKNPVGLAAGFDKNAALIDEMACFGFGFIEIGTLTPQPQPGNEKPRLFRLAEDQALINRMGFNNEGVAKAVEHLKKRRSPVVVGGNIGKNKTTPNDKALDDYAACIEKLNPYVDYFVVNVSSPNTPGLRELQEKEPLRRLLLFVENKVKSMKEKKPVLLKIAPDLQSGQLDDIIEIVRETGIDGVIATNTTISREGLTAPVERIESIGAGGLSGRPLKERALWVTRYLRQRLGPEVLIIGSGGIMTPQDAVDRMTAGADLIQVYTGFVYEGPSLVRRINKALLKQGIAS